MVKVFFSAMDSKLKTIFGLEIFHFNRNLINRGTSGNYITFYYKLKLKKPFRLCHLFLPVLHSPPAPDPATSPPSPPLSSPFSRCCSVGHPGDSWEMVVQLGVHDDLTLITMNLTPFPTLSLQWFGGVTYQLQLVLLLSPVVRSGWGPGLKYFAIWRKQRSSFFPCFKSRINISKNIFPPKRKEKQVIRIGCNMAVLPVVVLVPVWAYLHLKVSEVVLLCKGSKD